MDLQMLERLIPCRTPLIRQVAHRYLNNPMEIEDITQDVLIKLFTAARQETLRFSCLRRWVFTASRNAAIDSLRQHRRRRVYEDDNASARLNSMSEIDQPPLQIAATQYEYDFTDHLLLKLSELPTCQRTALLMSAFGYSYIEIANIQRISVGTVRSRIHYARTKAQTVLSAYR